MSPDPAALDRLVGQYALEGRSPSGDACAGKMTITRHGAFLHTQTMLNDSSVRDGLALPVDGRLVMAFGPKDKVEIGAYRIDGEQMTGLWVPPGAARDDFAECGHETSTGGDNGIWTIRDARAVDGTSYSGTVEVTPVAAAAERGVTPVTIAWKLEDGDYESFGLLLPDAMYTTFCFEDDADHGVAVYEITPDDLRGTTLINGAAQVGEETLRRI